MAGDGKQVCQVDAQGLLPDSGIEACQETQHSISAAGVPLGGRLNTRVCWEGGSPPCSGSTSTPQPPAAAATRPEEDSWRQMRLISSAPAAAGQQEGQRGRGPGG